MMLVYILSWFEYFFVKCADMTANSGIASLIVWIRTVVFFFIHTWSEKSWDSGGLFRKFSMFQGCSVGALQGYRQTSMERSYTSMYVEHI